MKTSWKWQAAFVVGVIVCIVLIDRVSGSATLTRASALAGICLELLNVMFGGTHGAANSKSWAEGKLKRLLMATPFLKFATVVVWLLSSGLGSYAGVLAWRESKLLTIQGVIEDADGALAAGASVHLTIGSQKWVTLANQGKYSFSKIDLRDEPTSFAVIEARWNGKEASKRIELTNKGLVSATIRLPLGRPPFRVQYFMLAGHSVDFFLKGMMDEHWEKQLAGQPYIVRNSTFDALSGVVERFSEPFTGRFLATPDYYALPIPPGYISPKDGPDIDKQAEQFAGMPMFVGTDASPAAASMATAASRKDIESLPDRNYDWHVTASPAVSDQKGTENLVFWRYGTPADLQRFSEDPYAGRLRLVSWLQYATKDFFPEDFCVVSMSSGCAEPDQSIVIGVRSVHLRIAVMENLTSHPIRLGSFVARENSASRLRARDDDQQQLAQQQARPYRWFPPQDLKPGERIAVPLEITFKYDKDKNWDLYQIKQHFDPAFLDELRSRFRQQTHVIFSYYANQSEHTVEVPSDILAQLLDGPAPDLDLQKEYIFGPSTRVEGLEVDDADYPVREFDPRLVLIRSGNYTGSCPTVYTFPLQGDRWANEGRILYGAEGREKEGPYSLTLTEFDGRVVVREEEHETTFIKRIYVSTTDRSGRKEVYYPTNWHSLRRKGEYLQLNQGDSIELQFPGAANHGAIRLIADGFYEVH
jgi:hypothetical protein